VARTPSTMLELGTRAPAFRLPNAAANESLVSRSDYDGQPLLVMFICNHCPFVIHLRAELIRLCHDALERGFGVVAINSNSLETHPQDGPLQMAEMATLEGWRFPYLFDESQAVAQAYRAACTPDFYLFDAEHKLVYRGQMDGSRPGNEVPVTGEDLRAAIKAVDAGQALSVDQRPSLGCNIKWSPGNTPDYYG